MTTRTCSESPVFYSCKNRISKVAKSPKSIIRSIGSSRPRMSPRVTGSSRPRMSPRVIGEIRMLQRVIGEIRMLPRVIGDIRRRITLEEEETWFEWVISKYISYLAINYGIHTALNAADYIYMKYL